MVLSDMVCGCVRGCLECCGIFLFHVLYPEGGWPAASDNKNKYSGPAAGWGGRES